MAYTYDQDRATLVSNGVDQFSVVPEVDPEMHGVLATPIWISKLNDGGATVDVPTRTVSFLNYGGVPRSFTARTEEQRDEVVAIGATFVSRFENEVGLSHNGSVAVVKILWSFIKTVWALFGQGNIAAAMIPGPAGPAGSTGATGSTGPTGPQGPTMMSLSVANTVTLTNMTLADAELPATQFRLLLDLGAFTQFRATMRVATQGSTNSDLRFQGSLDDSSFTNLNGTTGPEIAINTQGEKDSGWVTLAAQFQVANVRIRMMGKDGDGAADPVVRQIFLHFK